MKPMLKALRTQLFTILLAIIAVALAFTFYAKKYAYKQHEDLSVKANQIIASQTHSLIQPFLPKLFAESMMNAHSDSNITDFALLNDINQALMPVLKSSPATHVYIKDKNNKTLFSKSLEKNSLRTFHKLSEHSHLDKIYHTALISNDSEFLTSSVTPLLPINSTQYSGTLHLITNHSETRKETHNRVSQYIQWGQLLVVLICIGTILFHLNNLKFYKLLKNRIAQLTTKLSDSEEIDPLTKLLNRKSFLKKIDKSTFESSQRAFSTFTVFLMDLDDFKSVNEAHGHLVGDRLLAQAGQRIKNAVPNDSIIARLASNTFGVIVKDSADLQNISGIAKNILSQFETPFIIDEKHLSCSTSVGIVMSNKQEEESAENLVRNTEMSMYRAKRNKHGTYEIFTPNMHVESLERFKKERDIKRGIQAKEIFNRYQPIVDLKTGLTHSFEALARWQHPEKGELAPYYFIDLAEETGLIGDIDRNALEGALSDLSDWHKDLPTLSNLTVNVNHSAKEFNQRPTMDIILEQLSKHNISPSCLKIELTESSIIENEALASTIFESLREKGILFCMDDFGTGFSSINYLRKLNFDMLKIDRSFVIDIVEDGDSRKIVQTIINMGHNLGLSVTAEGVETEEQMNVLKNMGCQYAQGYYFAKPMVKGDVIGFLREQIEQAQHRTTH